MKKMDQFREEVVDLYAEINLKSLLPKIAEKVKSYLNCAESTIFLYNPEKQELYFEIVTGAKQKELKQIVMKMGEGVVGWIAEHETGVIINNCRNDPRFTSSTDLKTDFKTTSIAGVPVVMDGKLLGVIEAINHREGKFSEKDRELLEYISHFVAIPLQNALLFKKVTQEGTEKALLIELGKIISYAGSLDEIFQELKTIIRGIVDPREINVMVESQRVLYKLLTNEAIPFKQQFEKTSINRKSVVFPLRTRNRTLGFLQVIPEKSIPEEMANLIKGIAVFAAISIEKFEFFKQILEKEKIEKEIQIARTIQQSFLINKKIDANGLDVSFINIPSSQVGGDYYDIILLNDQETIFTINDISGHGIPASLLMAIFRTSFTYQIKKDRNILKTISDLNNLIAETTDPNLYVTSFTGMVDIRNRRMRWINAGHIPPFIIRQDEVLELGNGGLVLGMFPDTPFHEVEMEIQKDDFLVLYTDGVTEAEDCRGQQFSFDRFVEFVKQNRSSDTESMKEKIIAELRRFTGKSDFEDDVTFILIKIQ